MRDAFPLFYAIFEERRSLNRSSIYSRGIEARPMLPLFGKKGQTDPYLPSKPQFKETKLRKRSTFRSDGVLVEWRQLNYEVMPCRLA
jgi:hypothetical protein